MSHIDAIRQYGERVNHFVDSIAQDPDNDKQTAELAEVIVREAGLLAEEGPAAYVKYVTNLNGAAPATGEEEEEGDPIPVALSGGIHHCWKCERKFTSTTYHVVLELGIGRFMSTCRYCANIDPEDVHWQGFCDVADMIDAVMKSAPDKRARDLLKVMIADCAENFSVWRWDADGNPLQPLDEA